MAKFYEPTEKLPTILMFQPTRFEIVEGDRLKEWEEHLRDHVGLSVTPQGAQVRGNPSICFCPYADDCDEV
ncbi:hypothetical protein [Streptomyces sp. NPDC012616]|uniref:hypothetical protein n=1 Tax=Streptomyces sp. NPDC012616 TaxID=3364840 RepID=UPI0036E2733B